MKTGAQLAEAVIDTVTERRKGYGSPAVNFQRIATGWGVILGGWISPAQVALCMDWVKTCRLIETPDHEDSVLDKMGYAACYADVCEGKPDVASNGAGRRDTADPAYLDAPLPDYMTFRECEGCSWPVDCRTKGTCKNFAAVEVIHGGDERPFPNGGIVWCKAKRGCPNAAWCQRNGVCKEACHAAE